MTAYKWAYYNEIDPKAAAWIRELIKAKLITDGEVDERSIVDVQADDVRHFRRCHWFAGIAGWEYALRLAGIPDEYPVWTGSCPCQPFSVAGANKGKSDERHLWPAFFELIKQSRPITVFGEQVEGAVKHGWLDDLQADMEREGYTVGAAVLGAHSVGSFHQRQRLYWVANDGSKGHKKQLGIRGISRQANDGEPWENTSRSGRLGGAKGYDKQRHWQPESINGREIEIRRSGTWCDPEWIYCRDGKYRPIKSGLEPLVDGVPKGMGYSGDPDTTGLARVMRLRGYGNAIVPQTAAEFIRAFFDVMEAA